MSNPQNDRQSGQHSQARSDLTIYRMSKLKKEMEFLERGMQRIRMKLAKLQSDPTQTPVTSRIGSTPKKIINQQDYYIDQGKDRNQEIYNTNMYYDPYPTIKQWQFYEEQAQFKEGISQLIDKKSTECFVQKRPQPMPELTVQTGDSKSEQTTGVNVKTQEQNSNDCKI